ncbi:DNA polymerase III subunit delta [Sphingomonas solaris]|uniref:DNA-directed DNA polymerase n=1 Tax=Alterirhizorhabdus solaris TaxID=2529389 RepID=A0A558QWF1_9SPHN|nr:DNA polymerase III subunit delta [Sphingomonas solaris]TVV71470.1 DNA polymerase III subunit delta [Sphingomonas solaris]
MKASRPQIERALDTAPADIRLFLLHGPDESQSRELAARLARRMGPEAERVDLSGAQLKGDPARLTDEAASISLFGGARHIRIEPAGDDAYEAVTALLEAPSAGNPVVMVAGALRKDSRLLKRALADPAVLAFASYLPEGGDIDRLAGSMAREQGLVIDGDVARRLATGSGGDRALLAREIEKLALYVDAAPDRPAPLDRAMFDEISADTAEGDLSRLVDMLISGRPERLGAELARLAIAGQEGIGLLRPLLRRLMLLAELRAEVDRGNGIEAVMGGAGRAVFWKEKAAVATQLSRWSGEALAKAIERVTATELAVKASGSAGPILVEAELVAIARFATRLRP